MFFAKKIVFTNGCFDILHAGHVIYLEKAKNFGDLLILGLNSDRSVQALKGKGRPINNLFLQWYNVLILIELLQTLGMAYWLLSIPIVL